MNMISPLASFHPYGGRRPVLGEGVFVADGARIIGDVQIGADCSVWYNTVIRGDVNYIRIGAKTNIQDNSMLHVTNGTAPLIIGEGVTVGHNVTLHGCVVEDYCLIGIGAVVLDHARISSHSMVAAGAVVTPNFTVPEGTLVAGVPAKVLRELTEEEIRDRSPHAERYVNYARKSWEGISLNRSD
jgi:carbonic anhydrase/acetyltransferase-like protein (isoleucine patch superfamily)